MLPIGMCRVHPSRPCDTSLRCRVRPAALLPACVWPCPQQWIKMDATQPLVISGPRGAGKSTLVGHVIDHRPNVVRIDVRALLEKKEELLVSNSRHVIVAGHCRVAPSASQHALPSFVCACVFVLGLGQVHDIAHAFGFYPGFRGVQAVSRLFDIVTPGASASLASNDNQILQVLEMAKRALEDLVRGVLLGE